MAAFTPLTSHRVGYAERSVLGPGMPATKVGDLLERDGRQYRVVKASGKLLPTLADVHGLSADILHGDSVEMIEYELVT